MDAWFEERPALLRRTGFPRRPRMAPGDRCVYYASVWRAVFAVVEVTAEPELTGRVGTDRWPWTVDVEPLLAIPLLDRAPPVEAVAPRLAAVLRDADVLVRWEADELLALLPATDRPGAERAAERLRQALDGTPIAVGSAHWVGDTAYDLLTRAHPR